MMLARGHPPGDWKSLMPVLCIVFSPSDRGMALLAQIAAANGPEAKPAKGELARLGLTADRSFAVSGTEWANDR